MGRNVGDLEHEELTIINEALTGYEANIREELKKTKSKKFHAARLERLLALKRRLAIV